MPWLLPFKVENCLVNYLIFFLCLLHIIVFIIIIVCIGRFRLWNQMVARTHHTKLTLDYSIITLPASASLFFFPSFFSSSQPPQNRNHFERDYQYRTNGIFIHLPHLTLTFFHVAARLKVPLQIIMLQVSQGQICPNNISLLGRNVKVSNIVSWSCLPFSGALCWAVAAQYFRLLMKRKVENWDNRSEYSMNTQLSASNNSAKAGTCTCRRMWLPQPSQNNPVAGELVHIYITCVSKSRCKKLHMWMFSVHIKESMFS